MATKRLFAGPGKVFVRDTPDPKGKKIQQLVWGDFIKAAGDEQDGWIPVKARNEQGWVAADEVQEERLLEINFVDVGQGDGAFIVTPDDGFGLVDAGEGDNMRRFLSWRFNLKLDQQLVDADDETHEVEARSIGFDFAIISHSDLDHYQGYSHLFGSPRFKFKRVYHNTLVERPADKDGDKFGERAKIAGKDCVVELIETQQQLAQVLGQFPDAAMKYLKLLRSAADNGRVDGIVGVTADAGHLEGFEADHVAGNGKPFRIEVLGPIPLAAGGARGLPTFGKSGVTKNGHSVIVRIKYGALRFLLGGDLNVPAENHLLLQRTGREPPAADAGEDEWAQYLAVARDAFGADIAKSCHHGSADFSTTFLRAIDAVATVISSGDEESYCHPRPDALGTIGRHSRGERPRIFSTELMRSSPESRAMSQFNQAKIKDLMEELEAAEGTRRKQIAREINTIIATKERAVAVYGMISLRTDGERVVIAQKYEKRAGSGSEFDLHWFTLSADGVLVADPSEHD